MKIDTRELKLYAPQLHAGDRVQLCGTLYTARDAAHKLLFGMLDRGEALPFSLEEAVIYYAGPTQAPAGRPTGAFGPTTSGRMDPYTPRLLDLGLVGCVGKGERSAAVCDAIVRNQSVYLCAIGGAGALCAQCIKECEVIAFEHLGCESVKRLRVEDFPLIVTVDCHGGNLFEEGRKQYKRL